MFLVKWKDFLNEENTSETSENLADNDLRLLEEFYKQNPAVEKDRRFQGVKKKGQEKTK